MVGRAAQVRLNGGTRYNIGLLLAQLRSCALPNEFV